MAYEEKEEAVNDGNATDGTSGDEKILIESREGLQACIEDEHDQREKMLDDLRFAALDQWPEDVRAMRENDVVNGPRPCLTIDQVNQFITQVTNDMRSNRPSIKTRPVDDIADPETAKIMQGLVRHIEDQSSAQIAYGTAGESEVTIGLGFCRVVSEFVDPMSFDQELKIVRVPDTFSVYLSRHLMPDGSDAEKGWVFERMPLETFKRKYPGKRTSDQDFAGLGVTPVWRTDNEIIVCEYFYKRYEQKELLFLANGKTVWADEHDGDESKITGRRKSHKVSIQWCKHTGCDVLEKETLPGKYIPIVEFVGKEKLVDGKRHLWGLVRPAKDSLRAFNYWISAMTEKMALAPKAPFIGAVGQFATSGDKWDKANTVNYARLEYDAIDVNGNVVPAPRRQEPVQMEAAMANMLSIMQNNVKSSLGMYKAAVGEAEAQQSGRAILALKRESDTGTMHFGDNQGISIAQVGRILVDLIPHYYDKKRTVRILGEDGKVEKVEIDPDQEESMRELPVGGSIKRIFNLNVGKYDVTVTTGPGYTTSRQEAATVMTELANSAKDPASAAIFGYGAVKNSDFHDSEEIMRMLKATLPPQVLQAEDTGEEVPAAAAAKMAQMQQAGQQLQQALGEAQQEIQQLKAGTQVQAAKVQGDMQAKQAELQLKAQMQEQELQLERQKAEAKIELERLVAQAKLELQAQEQQFQRECKMQEQSQAMEAKHQQEAESSMPQFMQALGEITQGFAQALDTQGKQIAALTEAVQSSNAPKQISLIQRDGRTVGATVTVQ